MLYDRATRSSHFITAPSTNVYAPIDVFDGAYQVAAMQISRSLTGYYVKFLIDRLCFKFLKK